MSKILISEPILTLRWSKRGFKGSRKWLDYSNINKISYFQKYGIPQKTAKQRKTEKKLQNSRALHDVFPISKAKNIFCGHSTHIYEHFKL